jgi:hypothetical protein
MIQRSCDLESPFLIPGGTQWDVLALRALNDRSGVWNIEWELQEKQRQFYLFAIVFIDSTESSETAVILARRKIWSYLNMNRQWRARSRWTKPVVLRA